MTSATKKNAEQVARFADMFSAMGTEARLRIMQLLLSAHPEGLVVGEMQEELEIPNSTLSHHLEKLRNEGWCGCAGRARFCGTQRTRKRCKRFCDFCMRSAARGTKRWSRAT